MSRSLNTSSLGRVFCVGPGSMGSMWERPSTVDFVMTQSEVIDAIGLRLDEATPDGSRIILFGSRARDEGDAASDYDVLVIEPAVENSAAESVRLRSVLDGLGAPIDVLVYGADVARSRAAVRGTVVERALREGRELTRA